MVYNSSGTSRVVDGYTSLSDDSANTYTFVSVGRHYISVDLHGCSPGSGSAATYSIEPEPAAAGVARRGAAGAAA